MSQADPTPEVPSEETSEQAEGQPQESAATPADPAPFGSLPLAAPPAPKPELDAGEEAPLVRPTLAFPGAAPAARPEPSPPGPPDPEAAHPAEPPASAPALGTPSPFETPPAAPDPLVEDASTSAPDPMPSGPFGGMPEVPLPDAGPPPAPVALPGDEPPPAPVPLPAAVPYPMPPTAVPPIAPPPVNVALVPTPLAAEFPVPAVFDPPVAEPEPTAAPVAEAPAPAAFAEAPARAAFAEVLQVGEFAALAAPEPEPDLEPVLPDPVPASSQPAAGGRGITDIDGTWIARSSRGGSTAKLPRFGQKKGEEAASDDTMAPVAEEGASSPPVGSAPEPTTKRRTGFTLGRKKVEAASSAPAEVTSAAVAEGSPAIPEAKTKRASFSFGRSKAGAATPAVPLAAAVKRRARFSLGRKKNTDDVLSDRSDFQDVPDDSASPAAEAPAWSQTPIPNPPAEDPATTATEVAARSVVPVSVLGGAFADVVPPPVLPEAVAPAAAGPMTADAVWGAPTGDAMWGVAPAASPVGLGAADPSPAPGPTETAERGRFSFTMPFSKKSKGPGSPKPGTSFPKGPKALMSGIVVLALVAGGLGYMFLGRSGSGGPTPAFALDLAAGQTYAYRFTFNVLGSAVAAGRTVPVKESLAAKMGWKVQAVDPSGVATVAVTLSDYQVTVNGKALPASQIPAAATSFTMKVGADGRVLSSGGVFGNALAGTDTSAGGLPGTNQLTPLLPGHDVSPGDTWAKTFKQDLPLGMGTLRYKTQSRYVRNEQTDGVDAAVIETKMTIPLHMSLDLAKALEGTPGSLPAGSHPVITYRGHSNVVDTGWFDPEQRLMVKTQVSGSFNMDMTFRGMPAGTLRNGSSVSFRGAMTMTLERA